MSDSSLYLLVLAAAAAHAGWNALLKNSGDRVLTLFGMRLGILPILFVSAYFLPLPSKQSLPYMAVHVAFIYVYLICLLGSYRTGDFSAVYPIARGSAPILILMVTYFLGVDTLSTSDIVATLVISFGIALFAMRSKLPAVALRYAFATGFMIAGYTTFAGMGVRLSGSIFTYIIWSELLVSLGIILFCLVFRKQGILPYFKIHWLSVSFISILAVSSFGLVLWVFNYLPVGPVAAVRESSIAFAVLFSAIFLREKIQSHKIIALLLVAVGVIILALQK